MEINLNWFYKIGIGCFVITAICTIANCYIYWIIWNIPNKAINIANVIFNCALVGMFYYLLKGQKIAQNISSGDTSVEEVVNAFNEAKSTLKRKQ